MQNKSALNDLYSLLKDTNRANLRVFEGPDILIYQYEYRPYKPGICIIIAGTTDPTISIQKPMNIETNFYINYFFPFSFPTDNLKY